MSKTSEAQLRAVAKWGKENQEQINLKVKKGTKEQWKKYCDILGENMVSMITRAVDDLAAKEGINLEKNEPIE